MKTGAGAFTPEGFIILSLSAILDFFTMLFAVLSFGLASKIFYVIASGIFIPWQMSKMGVWGAVQSRKKKAGTGGVAAQAAQDKIKKKIRDKIMGKLAKKAIPFVGDFLDPWTVTNYKILEGKF